MSGGTGSDGTGDGGTGDGFKGESLYRFLRKIKKSKLGG